jgi:Ca2+-binding RTX toxin-like protein
MNTKLKLSITLTLLATALTMPHPALSHAGKTQASQRLFAPAAKSPLAVGDSPSALATANLKGDAYDEVLVASAGRNRVEVLSNRNGQLRRTSTNPMPSSPAAIAADGGEGDHVLVLSAGSNVARAFHNHYFRTFVNVLSPGATVAVGDNPSAALRVGMSIAHESPAGALEYDGSVEWVTANRGSDDLSLIERSGESVEHLKVVRTVPVGDAPSALAGEPGGSFYVANAGSGTLTAVDSSIYNDQLKTETIPVGGEPVALAMANLLPGEHRENEIVVADRSHDRIQILYRDPPVPFQPRGAFHVVATYPVGDGPVDLAVGNFDERIGQDIAVVNSLSDDVSILRNDGHGHYFNGGTYRTGHHPVAIAQIAYGRYFEPDLVVANRSSDDLTILARKERGRCQGHVAKLRLGTGGRDFIGSDDGSNETRGLGGDDLIAGGGGNDCLRGEAGEDTLNGNGDRDLLLPGADRDWVKGGSGDDVVHARGEGRDRIDCGDGDDTVYADRTDTLQGCERVLRGPAG